MKVILLTEQVQMRMCDKYQQPKYVHASKF